MKSKNKESGQILISGMTFVAGLILFFAYLMNAVELGKVPYSHYETSRQSSVAEAARIANTLNKISYNNILIMTSILSAQEAFAKHFQRGMYQAYTQPYWKTGQIKNWFASSVLEDNIKDAIEEDRQVYNMYAQRALVMAKSISEDNIMLVDSLPDSIKSFFSVSSSGITHCLALSLTSRYYTKSGLVYIPGITDIVPSSNLNRGDCQVSKHNFQLDHDITFYLKNDSDNPQSYGISYVPHDQSWAFLQALHTSDPNRSGNETHVEPDDRNFIFSEVLFSTVFFHDTNLFEDGWSDDFAQKTARVEEDIISRISNPYFTCSGQDDKYGTFLTEENFLRSCELDSEKFYRAFFSVQWSPIVTDEFLLNL